MERFAFNASGTLVQAAFSSIALAAFWCALRRLSPSLPGSTNKVVLAVVVATILLNILWPPAAVFLQMGCLMLGLASIPMWIISLVVRKKADPPVNVE